MEVSIAFTSHGFDVQKSDDSIVVSAGDLRVQSLVTDHPVAAGGHMVCVEIATHSPRVGETPILEAFAGFGATQRAAVGMAFGKFLLGTFHTLVESLSDHECEASRSDLLIWQGENTCWRVYAGPVISQSEPEGAAISEQCGQFLEALQPLFLKTVDAGTHWLRVFVGVFQGQVQTIEVLLDNYPWPEGVALGRSWEWVTPKSYASARVFAVALAA